MGGESNRGRGLNMGQLTLSKGPARMGIRCPEEGADIPSKGFFSHDTFIHALDVQYIIRVYMIYKKNILFCAG
jgi:hypothetical protein